MNDVACLSAANRVKLVIHNFPPICYSIFFYLVIVFSNSFCVWQMVNRNKLNTIFQLNYRIRNKKK